MTPQWSGETVWGATAIIRELFGPAIVGMSLDDVTDIPAVNRRMAPLAFGNWFAKSALGNGLLGCDWERERKPVYELLGGARRSLQVPNRFSMGAYDVDRASRRARELVDAGFTTIKVKVGGEVDVDVARVAAVRGAAGEDITITVDSNGGWMPAQAAEGIERLQALEVEWFEQPLQRGNYTDLRSLRAETGAKILADESCFNWIECHELIQQQCCDAITVYPGKHGGLFNASEIVATAQQAEIPCTIGSNLEWDIGAAAMLHFVVAHQNMDVERLPGDCLGPSYHETSIAHNPIAIEGCMAACPDGPGLGIDVDWDTVERLRI